MRFSGWIAPTTVAIATSAVCCFVAAGYLYYTKFPQLTASKGRKRSACDDSSVQNKKRNMVHAESKGDVAQACSIKKEARGPEKAAEIQNYDFAADNSTELLLKAAKMVASEFIDEITEDLEIFIVDECKSNAAKSEVAYTEDLLGGGSWMMPSAEEVQRSESSDEVESRKILNDVASDEHKTAQVQNSSTEDDKDHKVKSASEQQYATSVLGNDTSSQITSEEHRSGNSYEQQPMEMPNNNAQKDVTPNGATAKKTHDSNAPARKAKGKKKSNKTKRQ